MATKLGHIWTRAAGTQAREPFGTGPFEADMALSDTGPLAALHNEHGPHADPLIRNARREKRRRRREERAAHDRQERRQRIEDEARDDGDHVIHGTSFWLASEEYQRLYQETLDLISDARQAAQRAYERALEQEQEARAALEEAQANAIVLPDGRRVYFTADGKRLYTEDDQQITDAATIAEAQRRRTGSSTTYEDFTARRDERTRAAQEVEDLRTAIRRLDDLERRMERDDLTPEELAQIRQETQDIVATLPPEARADYERMQSAKSGESEPMHRDADPAFAAAPNVNAEFQAARAATATQLSEDAAPPDDAPARKPLYRSAPGFE